MHWLKSKQFKLIISLLVSGILLAIIYRRVDLAVLRETLFNLSTIPAVVFLMLIISTAHTFHVKMELVYPPAWRVSLGFIQSMQQVVGSYSANLLIPGKWGEIVRIPWMKKYNLKVPVLFMVFLEKALDTLSVVTILFISSLALLVTGYATPVPLMPFVIISGIVALLVVAVVLSRKYLGTVVTRISELRKSR
jgi:hypothetical protein